MISVIRFFIVLLKSWVICFQLNAQPTILVSHDKKEYLEEFDVLESNRKMKHGSYLKIIKGPFGLYFDEIGNYKNNQKHGYWEKYYLTANNIEYSGFFKNGLKDSVWSYYYHQGEGKELIQKKTNEGIGFEIKNQKLIIKASGTYANGNRIGSWKFFDEKGELFQIFDYDKQSLLFSMDADRLPCNPLLGDGDTFETDLFESINFQKEFAGSIKPDTDKSVRIIEIEFKIDRKGLPIDPVIKKDELDRTKLNTRILESLMNMKWYFNPACQTSVMLRFTILARNQSSRHRTENGDFMINGVATSFSVKYLGPSEN